MCDTGTRRFISGVVEGFYGRPWSMQQRTQLFQRQQRWGLNTYMYAPKDDSKHRMFWRDLYTPEEAEQLRALIAAAQQHQVDFIYALSPGLDMTFSSPRELSTLKRKLDQVKQFGCSSFSLLFDDIEGEMCPADQRAFSSLAHAQVEVTNAVYQHLGQPHTFLFCPTDYCAAFCTPSVSQSSYLRTVGEELLPGIDVLWTGPKVVSHKISVASIEEVSSVLRRAPVIWDNIHANDYDPQRLFLGPYKDRPTELIPRLRGVLSNPNCEFHPNFVALHTLASWCKAPADGEQRDVEMGGEEEDPRYSPQKALSLALSDWLQELLLPLHPGPLKKESSDEEPMQTEAGEGGYAPGAEEKALHTAQPLRVEDLQLLSHLFYLPHQHGPTARTMLTELHWLRSHQQEAAGWSSRALRFDQMCEAVVQMSTRLLNAPNRSAVYDLHGYVCDIKSSVCLARAYVKSLGGHQAQLTDPEAWTRRGGLSGELQRMLPAHGDGDMFRQPPRTRLYCIRACCPEDQVRTVLRLCSSRLPGLKHCPLSIVPPQLSTLKPCPLSTLSPQTLSPLNAVPSQTLSPLNAVPSNAVPSQHCPLKRCPLSTLSPQTQLEVLSRETGAGQSGAAGLQPLLSQGLLDGALRPSPGCALVLEDEAGLCGCALALVDAQEAAATSQGTASPSVLEEFPSLVTMQLLPRVTDSSPAERMMRQLLSSVRKAGSRGAFCELRPSDQTTLEFYTKLGCFQRVSVAGDLVVMGTSL